MWLILDTKTFWYSVVREEYEWNPEETHRTSLFNHKLREAILTPYKWEPLKAHIFQE